MVSNRTHKQRGHALRIAFGITLLVLFVGVGFVQAETQLPLPPEINFSDSFQFPWRIEGNGTYFELNKSEYLNTTLYSSESIKLILESVPEMVTIHIESNSDAISTQITLGGFLPLTTYHKYEDNYHNHVAFTTDANGNYTYTQDLSHKHLVFIQPKPSTKFIIDDATGGDCTTFGTWDATIKTCTLTTDLTDTIQIDSDGITLEGNGYTLTGLGDGSGVFLSGRTGVNISNLNINDFSYGIYLGTSSYNTISSNNLSNNSYGGIYLDFSSYNTVSSNNLSNNSYGGIWLISSSYNTVSSNNISNHIFGGIYLSKSSNNQINANIGSNNGPVDFVGGIFVGDIILVMNSNNNNVSSNNVSKSNFGIMLAESSNYNTVSGNIVSNSKGGIVTFLVSNNILSGNTVLDNNLGIWVYQSSNNMVKNNTVLNSRTYGIGVSSSNNMESCCNNIIYNNNLINNPTQAIVYTDNNIFNLEAPIGGNYYSDYDTPEEGCNNINGDNFCDEPYVFSSGWDNLPWISPDGWLPRGNTPVGSNVQINPDAHVSILYNEVTTAGDTTVTQSTTNPGPDKDDFMFLGNYYELSTSAVFTPPVTVCINYDDIGMPLEREAHLKIFHWSEGGTGWDDVTSPGYPDIDRNIICGQVDSFSYFVVGYDNSGPIVSNIVGISDPVKINTDIILNAPIDDTTNGSSNIKSAEYSIDGASWKSMSATDGLFDEPAEEVTATVSIPEPGVYDLCIRGIDVVDNTGQEKCNLLVVYDPSGGFVTGGGWIISKAGAYTADTLLEGHANFGFVSKYQKGANIPTGETEFQFKEGNLNFKSTVYQWLVVAGVKAQYKGSGTINGTGDYGFLLTATDGQLPGGGGVDKFRIKIVDKATGTVVYDNVGGSDDMEAVNPQEIGGGSIVIHK